jgi:hypothetical protein
VRDRATRAAGRERAHTARGAAPRPTLLPLAARTSLVGAVLMVGLALGGRGAAAVMGWSGSGAWAIGALVAAAAAVVAGVLHSLLAL